MSAASMLWIPGYAIYYIATERGSLRDVSQLLNNLLSPVLVK
jgi:hypothetical protein